MATAASPAVLKACISISRESPERSAPWALAARRAWWKVNRLKRPVTYLAFGEEQHDFVLPGTWAAFWAAGERFLAAHLGGRYEPYGDDFRLAAFEVRMGAERIPGLRQALSRGLAAGGSDAAPPGPDGQS